MRIDTTAAAELVSRHISPPWGDQSTGFGPVEGAIAAGWGRSRPALLLGAIIVVLIGVSYWITYETGGTRYAVTHIGYLPVLLAAIAFGLPGGFSVGILVGLCLGPAMPLDTELHVAQPTINWAIRCGFFVIIGSLAGAVISLLCTHYRRLNLLACFDRVTNLPNGSLFYELLNRQVQCRPDGAELYCVFIDHPTFEEVLLTLGSREADELLAKLARGLERAKPDGSVLCHMRGGRFAIYLTAVDADGAMAAVRALNATSAEPIDVGGIPISVESHCGLARFSPETGDSWALSRQAAAALEHAEQQGVEIATYDEVTKDRQPDALMILGELRKALTGEVGLHLAYQPQIEIATGRCIGAEALLRWTHDRLGAIPPGRFIPLAEKTAMIRPLTQWVIGTAVRQCAEWEREGLDLPISVNISARDLGAPGFAAFVRQTIERHGVAPGKLELELTETAVMGDLVDTLAILTELADLGLRIAIDDFGTGYSSLERMKRLPARTLKIDQSFICHLAEDPNDVFIVRSSIALAHSMGMKVVAEGVETQAAADLLREFGCDCAQGYLIARPLDPAGLRAWLARSTPDPAPAMPDHLTSLASTAVAAPSAAG
ncbi:MAG: EAL domain-containing protein [Rhodospirillaceae bacterium]|nr:EAL domain-containing protein [Rhodospirillaceae bacterium]